MVGRDTVSEKKCDSEDKKEERKKTHERREKENITSAEKLKLKTKNL